MGPLRINHNGYMTNNGQWKILFTVASQLYGPLGINNNCWDAYFQQHFCIGQEPSTTGLNPNTIRVSGLGGTGFKTMTV
jgi:hypothetical protein